MFIDPQISNGAPFCLFPQLSREKTEKKTKVVEKSQGLIRTCRLRFLFNDEIKSK